MLPIEIPLLHPKKYHDDFGTTKEDDLERSEYCNGPQGDYKEKDEIEMTSKV